MLKNCTQIWTNIPEMIKNKFDSEVHKFEIKCIYKQQKKKTIKNNIYRVLVCNYNSTNARSTENGSYTALRIQRLIYLKHFFVWIEDCYVWVDGRRRV